MRADESDAFGQGTNALLGNIWIGSSYRYSPYRVSVGPDDSVYCADLAGEYTASVTQPSLSYSAPGGGVWMASPNFSVTTNLFNTNDVGSAESSGAVYSGVYGLYVTGSLAKSNLVMLALEWDLGGSDAFGNTISAPAVWQYTYNSTTNSVPMTNPPTGLFTVGLGINAVLGDMSVDPVSHNIYALQDRNAPAGDSPILGTGEANNNNAGLYVYDSTGVTNIWESGIGGAGIFAAGYGVAVSPDGNWVAVATGFGTTLTAHITNGIPDLSTVVTNNEEPGAPSTSVLVSARRGVAFDAADNVITSLPQTVGGGNDAPTAALPAVVREYSLGFSSIATTSNDSTGTNGAFNLLLVTPGPTITAVTASGGSVTLTWTSPGTADTTTSFTVQSSASVSGPYADINPAATITQPGGPGTIFQATVPANSPTTFYRLRHL